MKKNQSSFYYEEYQSREENHYYKNYEIKKKLLEKYKPSNKFKVVQALISTKIERRAA